MSDNKQHHEYSPSKWSVWDICPFYDSTDKESDEASEGTRLHKMLAEAIASYDAPVNEENVMFAIKAIHNLLGDSNSVIHIEEQQTYKNDTFGIIFTGTPDFYWLDNENIIHVVDFKSFSDGVSFNHIPQLMGYALAIAYRYSCNGIEYNKDKFKLHVINGGSFTVTNYECSELEAFNKMFEILTNRKTKAGCVRKCNSHCKYCKHASTCKKCEETMNEINELGIAVKDDSTPSIKLEDVPSILDKCNAVESAVKAIREKMKEIVTTNGGTATDPVTGSAYKIAEENGAAKLTSIKDLFSFLSSNGVTSDAFLAKCKIGLPDSSKLLREADFTLKNDKESRAKLAPYFEVPKVMKLKKVG